MGKVLIKATAIVLSAIAIVIGYNWLTFGRVHGDASPIEFTGADGVRLYGVLYAPKSSGPHPAIVLLHGSGRSSGASLFVTGHANAFLKHGIAVLTYDKRGSGRSGGDFDSATYADFINDAIASVKLLRGREDIISDRIALFGSSESGWFTPEIAKRSGEIAFIINRAGPPLNWIDTNIWEKRNELIDAGLTNEEELASILSLRKRIWDYYEQAAAAQDPLPELRAQIERELESVDPRWVRAIGMRLSEYDQKKFERFLVDILYDPTPYWEDLEIPALSLHGDADQNVPTHLAIAAFDRLNREFGKKIDVEIYAGYKHGLGKYRNFLTLGYPPGYFPLIGNWADEQFRAANGD